MAAASVNQQQQQLKEARETAAELIALLRAWISKRRRTIQTLRDIADELDTVQQNVNIAKAAGYTTSILGGAAGVAGILLTGGLALPIVVGGVITAVAGTVTTSGATVIGGLVSEGKLQKAQEALDADKKLVIQIEEKKLILEKLSTELSHHFRLAPKVFLGLLIMSALSGNLLPNLLRMETMTFVVIGEVAALRMFAQSMGNVGKGLATALGEISLKGLFRMVGSVLAVTLGGVLVVWDAIKLVETLAGLSNGSKTAVASNLRDIAGKLKTQPQELECFLEKTQQQSQDFETLIKKRFRQRLRAISKNGYATDTEADEVFAYLQAFTTPKWQQHFTRSRGNLNTFVFWIARVFHLIYKQVKQHTPTEEEEDERRRELTVILIAHGNIETTIMLPVGLYYATDHMEAVTLYEPWGCSIDTSVVYGIAANYIKLKNVSYSGQVYRNQTPALPTDWNTLPRNEANLIPTLTFSPVVVGEGAYMELMTIIGHLQMESDGLILPYFTGDGKDILPFPNVPLYVITTVLALRGSLTRTYIKLRVASCLSVRDGDYARRTGVIECNQYYVVSPNQKVMMTNRFTARERERLRSLNFDNLNQFL